MSRQPGCRSRFVTAQQQLATETLSTCHLCSEQELQAAITQICNTSIDTTRTATVGHAVYEGYKGQTSCSHACRAAQEGKCRFAATTPCEAHQALLILQQLAGAGRQRAYKDCGGASVLEGAGACRLLQSHLRLHTCHRLGVLVKGTEATRDYEFVLRSLHTWKSLCNLPEQRFISCAHSDVCLHTTLARKADEHGLHQGLHSCADKQAQPPVRLLDKEQLQLTYWYAWCVRDVSFSALLTSHSVGYLIPFCR